MGGVPSPGEEGWAGTFCSTSAAMFRGLLESLKLFWGRGVGRGEGGGGGGREEGKK